ncbi:unnamed protein product [Moneuplotes crassus]|uniref:RING-type domain-containing protein n=1 Tax=Euplotes crassus TaxID=5936 RepID=A0AAD1XSA8_EUPCR|nr:unnamed protein product [Moneuplotes crassus]
MERSNSFEDLEVCDEGNIAPISIHVPEMKTAIKRSMVKCMTCERKYQAFSRSLICPECKTSTNKEVTEEEKKVEDRPYELNRIGGYIPLRFALVSPESRINRLELLSDSSSGSSDLSSSSSRSDFSDDRLDSEGFRMLRSRILQDPNARQGGRRGDVSSSIERVSVVSFRRSTFMMRNNDPMRFFTPDLRGWNFQKPVNKDTIDNLKSVQITDEHLTLNPKTRQKESPCCCVCTDEMQIEATILPCKHLFHTECIKEWFKRHNTCPICRSKLT